jgi:hypothetical protein
VPAVLELASRVGYVARGAVYLSVGVIALLAALDLAPTAAGAMGAMQAWGSWPFGLALLVLAGWGLMAFALWRALQALLDADGHGRTPRALLIRGGQAISGLVHAALAMSAFEVADGLEDLSELDEDGAAQAAAAAILDMPGGDLALIVVGGFILAVGIANIVQGLFYNFAKRLDAAGRWAWPLGKIGYLGRGIAFIPLGFFIAESGLDARAHHARSLGGALQTLEAQPFGSLVLSLTALGLIAFGLFALAEARYRRMSLLPKGEGGARAAGVGG